MAAATLAADNKAPDLSALAFRSIVVALAANPQNYNVLLPSLLSRRSIETHQPGPLLRS